jgi:hypothetical protein
MRRNANRLGPAGWIVLVVCLYASAADAQERDLLSYWVNVVGGWTSRTGPGLTLLEPSETIEVTFIVLNSEHSQDPVILGDGFFRRLTIELVDPESGDVLATLSEWRDFGTCAEVPNCPIDVSMILRPGESAGFNALLTTTDGQPPAFGMRGIRVALGEARQRILAADGSLWSGRVGNGGTVPLELREVRTAEEARTLESQEIFAAWQRGDHAEALRMYQARIARDPLDGGAHAGAGRELVSLGRLTEAAAAYERALALGAEGPALPNHMITVYFALGDDARAMDMLRRYVPTADLQRAEGDLRQAGARLRARSSVVR